MYYEITKQFNLSIGHRVWSQQLDPILSCDAKNKCRHLHGHNITVSVTLQNYNLQDGLVLDFGNLTFFKNFLDSALDHKFLLDLNDPMLKTLFSPLLLENLKSYKIYPTKLGINTAFMHFTPNPEWSLEEEEFYNSFVFMKGVPTAEHLSYHLYLLLMNTLSTPNNTYVKSVSVQETSSAGATTFNEDC